MPTIDQAPLLYTFALSLHLIGGNFLSSFVYRLRFGGNPNLLLAKDADPAHRRATRRLSACAVLWTLLLLQAAFLPATQKGFPLAPLAQLPPLAGWIVFAGGLIMMLIAQFGMGSSFRIGQSREKVDDALKTDGLWRFSRNPIYLFSGLALAGAGLWVLSPAMLFTLGASAYFFHRLILAEETYLESVFGNDYLAYKERTLRYLGRRAA